MKRASVVWYIGVPLVVIVGIAGVVLAGRLGTATGTTADPTQATIPAKRCPTGGPNACWNLIARTLHLDASDLPTIADKPRLTYQRGQILTPKDGAAPVVVFDYESANPPRIFQVTLRLHAAPTKDRNPIGATPHGRTYRSAQVSPMTMALVFYDQHLMYTVGGFGFDSELAKNQDALALAQQLVDALHPATRQVDP